MKYEWKYGENDNQKYYDVTVGKITFAYLQINGILIHGLAHTIAFVFTTRQKMTE